MAPPPHLENIKTATETLGFNMASISTTGVLPRSGPGLEVEYRDWSSGNLLARKIAA